MSISTSTSSVVERASKEFSRRMSSLGFKTNQEKTSDKSGPVQNPPASPKLSAKDSAENSQQTAEKLVLSESDKLNGNNQGPDQPLSKQSPVASSSSEQDGAQPVRRRVKPLCAAAKQPAARASMGAIIKGSVMDKVTHVFNQSGVSMGNANNSKTASDKPEKPSAAQPASGPVASNLTKSDSSNAKNNKDSSNVEPPVGSVISANDVKQQQLAGNSAPSGINIPKGAVANGRAKFEATPKGPEKPSRFFGSRSRTNSPMLPVKTPKVPDLKAKDSKANNEISEINSKKENNSNGGTEVDKKDKTASKPPTLNLVNFSSNKLLSKMKKFVSWDEVWQDNKFLFDFFQCFSTNQNERAVLAQVCQKWREVLYQPEFWREVRPVIHCRAIRSWSSPGSTCTSSSTATSSTSNQSITNSSFSNVVTTSEDRRNNEKNTSNSSAMEVNSNESVTITSPTKSDITDKSGIIIGEQMKLNFFNSLKQRGFDTICLLNGNDADIFDFIQNFPHGATGIHSLILRCCNISDRGLEAIMEFLQGLYKLEIAGCNEITEQGLWSSLHPRLASLTINDCINVADECVCAVTQLLPALYEFNLQAYHVTDSALSYFSPKQTGTLNILRLQSCWEITNHGIVNIVHTLPNLTVLSLSGCSKITDDGIELIAENLRKLRSLDLSWCPRVTDAALEYIACDLNHLEELTLDRCVHITDIGIGYISTMLALHTLYLRWCTQIRDFGLQHICGMRSMQILSLAGCPLLTSTGMSNLIQLRHLQELELTNCPGATSDLIEYLRTNLPKCLVLD